MHWGGLEKGMAFLYRQDDMEVHFTREQQAHIAQVATKEGTDPEHLVRDAVLRFLNEDSRFLVGVTEREAAPDRGDSLTHEQVGERPKVAPDARPIWEIMLSNNERVPPEEFAKFPTDGAAEHDHYLYGSPKRN